MGLSAGFDYYHSKKQFVTISASAVISFELPFPAPIDYVSGEREFFSSNYLSLSNNHKIGRFSQGYGITLSRNVWELRNYGEPIGSDSESTESFESVPEESSSRTKSSNAWGLLLSSYIQIGQNFNIGLIYRPTFFKPDTYKQFQYEHLISIDLAWKILLKR